MGKFIVTVKSTKEVVVDASNIAEAKKRGLAAVRGK